MSGCLTESDGEAEVDVVVDDCGVDQCLLQS